MADFLEKRKTPFKSVNQAVRLLECEKHDFFEGERNVWFVKMPEFVNHQKIKQKTIHNNNLVRWMMSTTTNLGLQKQKQIYRKTIKIFDPPGTGKTWTLIERVVKKIFKKRCRSRTIAFHIFYKQSCRHC